MKAITDRIKVSETIVDRVGGYNFLPALIASGSTRKQCPLYSANPHGQTESSLLGCARSDRRRTDWSLCVFQTQQHEPHDSTGVGEGQSGRRGQPPSLSLFIAGDRLRCEPGSKPVIVTNALTSVEGHVPSLGDKGRRRKIFVGCPAFLSFWDQSPLRYALRSETVGNRLYPIHGQIRLCRYAAEAQIQDRSRSKTGPNTAPGFSRVSNPTPPQPIHRIKQERASGRDFSKTYFLWMSTDSMTSPCSMARTTSMPLVTLPKTAWQEVPRTSQGFS